jgi:hypothetical protein
VIAVAFAVTQITGLLKQVQPDKISLIFDRLNLFDIVLVILTGFLSSKLHPTSRLFYLLLSHKVKSRKQKWIASLS